MKKQIALSILLVFLGLPTWGQNTLPTGSSNFPESVVPEPESQDHFLSPGPEPMEGESNLSPEDQQYLDALKHFFATKGRETYEGDLRRAILAVSEDAASNAPELKVTTLRLEVPIPENILALMAPLLGKHGQYSYDDDIGLLVFRGTEEDIEKATAFVREIAATYQDAFHEAAEKAQPTPVQIEAVLIIGRKGEGQPVSATGTGLPYPLPAEIASMGLKEVDLLPFAFGEVEVEGRAVLHTDIPPTNIRPHSVATDLGDHHLEFSIAHRLEPAEYPYLSVTASYNPIEGEETDAPPMAGQLGGLGGLGGVGGFGGVQSGFGDFRGAGRSSNPPDGRGRRSAGGGFGADPTMTMEDGRISGASSPRSSVGMTSEPRVVFDRPILVGSYKPTPDETAIVVIRLKELKD